MSTDLDMQRARLLGLLSSRPEPKVRDLVRPRPARPAPPPVQTFTVRVHFGGAALTPFDRALRGRCLGCNGNGCIRCARGWTSGYPLAPISLFSPSYVLRMFQEEEGLHPADAWTLAQLEQIPVSTSRSAA